MRNEAVDAWRTLDRLARSLRIPRGWIVCPICGEFSWRFPPHGIGEACPIAQAMAEAGGLKLDAERMTALRAGVHLEAFGQTIETALREAGLLEDEDDD